MKQSEREAIRLAEAGAAAFVFVILLFGLSTPFWLPLWWAYALPCMDDPAPMHACWSPAHRLVQRDSRDACICAREVTP